ncbi:hypothetical protein [Pseudobutyrivibrio ruminis]|uniref:hypothetical protein n=1 Tax=Pseudobutyrivibrio ruminis TaxID=46206 RepID=UPI000B333DCC|nr:hypothetical protein [Pseudobutyrivibrio ruminis]
MYVKEDGKVELLDYLKQKMAGMEKPEDSSKLFEHKSFSERLKEYDGEIEVYEFDWGESVGREMV